MPGVYVRVYSDDPFDLENDDRKALCGQISGHMYQQQYAETAEVAKRLFAAIDLNQPDLPVRLLEAAIRDRVRALAALALAEF